MPFPLFSRDFSVVFSMVFYRFSLCPFHGFPQIIPLRFRQFSRGFSFLRVAPTQGLCAKLNFVIQSIANWKKRLIHVVLRTFAQKWTIGLLFWKFRTSVMISNKSPRVPHSHQHIFGISWFNKIVSTLFSHKCILVDVLVFLFNDILHKSIYIYVPLVSTLFCWFFEMTRVMLLILYCKHTYVDICRHLYPTAFYLWPQQVSQWYVRVIHQRIANKAEEIALNTRKNILT